MNNKKTFKRSAIALAVSSATILAAGFGGVANAQDKLELEEVIVTGSNIPRAVSDAPSPITVINSLDIQLSGYTNTADILRDSAYNSFGSYSERSGSSFGQIATADLRGLGSQYTAVLINGRRVPGSPFTGASIVDLNTIPISAIERVELLKDGASAIYGADAVGGVVSITLKDDYEGFEVGGGVSAPSFEGGDSENFNLLWGKTTEKGNIMIGAEYFSRDPVFDADRDYSSAFIDDVPNPRFDRETGGISAFGNTGFFPDFSAAFPLGPCDTSVYEGVLAEPFGFPGTGCGFAYANRSMQTGALERKSIFINGEYEINEDMTAYADIRFNNNETAGRYAPAAGFFTFSSESPFNPLGFNIPTAHRFVGHGNRDETADIDELTTVFGLKGEFENGIGYDVWGQYFNYDALEQGAGYVQLSGINAEVAAGNYNVFDPLSQDPVHLAAIEASRAPLTRDIETTYTSAGVTFNGESFEMAGGNTGWAVGAEVAEEDYQDIYDQFRENFDVIGSAGNSASGDRSRWAVFGEMRLPVTEKFEINLAARHDDYDDVGTAFSPQISARFNPTDNVTLRASWGEGFKAPNLTSIHGAPSQSSDRTVDQTRCDALGISDCAARQIQTLRTSNPLLEPEDSTNLNFGIIVDLGPFSGSLDYYDIELTNAVTRLSNTTLVERARENDLPPGAQVNRAPTINGIPGSILDIVSPISNAAVTRVDGLDLDMNLNLESGIGNWDIGLQWVHTLSNEFQNTPNDEISDSIGGSSAGSSGFPEDRINTSIRLNREDVTLSLNSRYISSFDNPTETSQYESWLSHDVTVNWTNAFNVAGLELTAGVQNVTEEEPKIDEEGYDRSITLNLYSVHGRIPFVNFKYAFGQ
jgi:iron complex outermembrane receptor protein